MQPAQVSAAGTRTYYNDVVARRFAIMTVAWSIVAMLVGACIASELILLHRTADLPRAAADAASMACVAAAAASDGAAPIRCAVEGLTTNVPGVPTNRPLM